MAPPRKPTNVLQLAGTFRHNPSRGRAREGEPEAKGDIGDPPETASEAVQAAWREIATLAHKDSLCRADRLFMEHGCNLLVMLRSGTWQVHPSLMLRWEGFLAKLGMTPADRSRISVAKQKPGIDPLDEFARH